MTNTAPETKKKGGRSRQDKARQWGGTDGARPMRKALSQGEAAEPWGSGLGCSFAFSAEQRIPTQVVQGRSVEDQFGGALGELFEQEIGVHFVGREDAGAEVRVGEHLGGLGLFGLGAENIRTQGMPRCAGCGLKRDDIEGRNLTSLHPVTHDLRRDPDRFGHGCYATSAGNNLFELCHGPIL